MALTLEEQQNLAEIEAELAAIEADKKEAASLSKTDKKDNSRSLVTLVGKTIEFGGDVSVPAMGAAIGQTIGLAGGPYAPITVPVGGAIGGGLAYAGNEFSKGKVPTLGALVSVMGTSAIPVAGPLASGTRGAIMSRGAREGLLNIAAAQGEKAIDEGRVITPKEAVISSFLPVATGVAIAGRRSSEAADAVARNQNAARDSILQMGQALGFTLDAVQSNPTIVTKGVERVAGGQTALQTAAARRNQQVTNNIVRSEIGLPADAALDDITIALQRDRVSEPYRQIAAISPAAATALENLRRTRTNATRYWRQYARDNNVDAENRAIALDATAQRLENQLEVIARAVPDGDTLVARLRDARRSLAKIHVVERALNPDAGNVDARVLGRIHGNSPNYLTDGLRAVAELANVQPSVMKVYVRESNPSVSAALNRLARAGTAGALGYGAGGPTIAGVSSAVAGLADIPATALAGSRAYQSRYGVPNYSAPLPEFIENFAMQTTRQVGSTANRKQ